MRESDAAFASMRDGTEFETWEDLNLYDRCITRGMPGAMVPGFSQLGQWLGDSRAHWEGKTLVVETTNLTPGGDERVRNLVHAASAEARVVERFTRVAGDRIDYRFTLTDPASYERPWTVEIPMVPLGGDIFEYACHEGNYGLPNILAGARSAAIGSRTERDVLMRRPPS